MAQAAGEEGLRAAVELGLAKARDYGFGRGRPLMLYLECMCVLGSRFDEDPQNGWLRKFLSGG